jgi:periodic tryptophan protein 2
MAGKYAFRFSNLCGTVYRSGNLAFHPNGTTLYSPVGNRVTAFELKAHTSSTLDFEARSDVDRIAVSPDGRMLLAIDLDGAAIVFNLSRGVIVHRFGFKGAARAAAFSPDGRFLAAAHGKHLQVWRTPSLEREFCPFSLHRTYTGHYEEVTCLDWSPSGAYVATGSADLSARIYSLHPTPGFIPVTLGGHRESVVGVFFAEEGKVYTVARDGTVVAWGWQELPEASAAAAAALRRAQAAASGVEEGGEEEEEEATEEEEEAEEEMEGKSESEEEGEEGGDSGGGGGRKRRRRQQPPSAAGSEAAWNPALRLRAQPALSALSSRVRHPVPAPHAAAGALSLGAARGEWAQLSRHYFRAEGHARVTCATFHRGSGLLVAGFSTGVFSLHSLPAFSPVHSLSISAHEVHSAAVNAGGEWLAFGSRTLGQLLVWEWRSETFVLRQQGHFYDLNATAYSPNGQLIATGGDDGKVKVWNAATGFCFVTFAEHTAPVTALTFVGGSGAAGGGHGLAVLSASLDGTVRAYDLVRYRNFRTLSSPPGAPPVQFGCLAADEAGEVVMAGGLDPFNVYVWSLQTGRLLDVLSGHAAPVASLAFSAPLGLLASASWDNTVRLWDVFRSGTATETFSHGSSALAVAFRPDGAQLAAALLGGTIALWDTKRGVQVGSLDVRRDAGSGRRAGDLLPAAAAAAGAHFTALAYSPDGEALLAGGRTKWACLYAPTHGILLRRFQVSHNRSLDGMLEKLNSKNVGEGGVNLALLEDGGGGWEAGGGVREEALPGARRAGMGGKRATRPEVRTKCVAFSPTGRAFSAATTEGLLVFSLDDTLLFDPIELGEDTTPEGVAAAIAGGAFARALLLALHLGEAPLIAAAAAAPPAHLLPLIASTVPLAFLLRLVGHVAACLAPETRAAGEAGGATGGSEPSPHIEFYLRWALALLQAHARAFRERTGYFSGALRALQRALVAQKEGVGRLAETTRYKLAFLEVAGAVEGYAGAAGEGDEGGAGEGAAPEEGREEEEERGEGGGGGGGDSEGDWVVPA